MDDMKTKTSTFFNVLENVSIEKQNIIKITKHEDWNNGEQ